MTDRELARERLMSQNREVGGGGGIHLHAANLTVNGYLLVTWLIFPQCICHILLRPSSWNCLPSFMTKYANYEVTHALTCLRFSGSRSKRLWHYCRSWRDLLASSLFGSSEGNVEEQICISDCCLITERPESYLLDQLSKSCLTWPE